MTSTTPSAAPFVLRLIAAVDQADPLGVHSAISDAETAGVRPDFLVIVLASMLQEVMTDRGFTLGDLHSLLLEEAGA